MNPSNEPVTYSEGTKLRLKRILSKYEYFLNDFKETEYLFEGYTKTFNKELNIVPKPYQIQPEGLEVIPEVSSEDSKHLCLTKLYRKLCMITHPDKGGSADIFKMVNRYYTDNNRLGLLLLSHQNGIDIPTLDFLSSYTETDFSADLLILSERTNRIKTSLAWVWQSADTTKRIELRQHFGF